MILHTVPKGLENSSAAHMVDYDTENIIEVELNKLETFEQLFFNLFLKVRQEIDGKSNRLILFIHATKGRKQVKI